MVIDPDADRTERTKTMKRTRQLLLGAACLLAAACGSDDATVDDARVGEADSAPAMHVMKRVRDKFEVTYQPDTVIVSDKAMQYLATPVVGSNRLEFSREAKPHLDLEEGKVTIFPMAALVRVVSWEETADRIVVRTEPASLTDAIKDADIQSEVEISWQQLTSRNEIGQPGFRLSLLRDAVASDGVGEASTSISYTWKHPTGLKIDFKLKPESADKLGFEISASASGTAYKKSVKPDEFARMFPTRYRNGNAFQPVMADESLGPNSRTASAGSTIDNSRSTGSAAYEPPDGAPATAPGDSDGLTVSLKGGTKGFAKASGHMSGFTQLLDLEIRDGEVQDMVIDFKSLSGEVKLEAAALQGLVSTFNLSIPVEYSFTVPLGGIIPLTFTLGAEISFRPIIEQGTSGSSQLCFLVAYDGSTGLEWSDGSFSNQSSVRRRDVGTCPNQETVSAGRLTVGMGATFNFPKFKVSLFHLPVATSIYVSSDGVTTYEPGIASALKACQAGKIDLKLVVEATMKLLGIADAKVQAKLWQGKKEWTCEGTVVASTFDKGGGEQQSVSDR